MASISEVSVEEEIQQLRMKRPHVVLLGAGASLAACPKGDKFGRRLPTMANLVETLRLAGLIPPSLHGMNFEEAYTSLSADPSAAASAGEIERRIYDYFSDLVLPDEATIYDYLVLSLQPKDVIATFNWDPFLIQAIRRHRLFFDSIEVPTILCLHGNVMEGYCIEDMIFGVNRAACSKCGRLFTASRLLYPVSQKNYSDNPLINLSWKKLAATFESAFMVTVFGYGAPSSDRDAVKLLNDAWGDVERRDLEQFEFIDIRKEEELVVTWKPFIHSHHFNVETDYFDSSLALHPRRTGEDFINRLVEGKCTTPNRPPRGVSLVELRDWHAALANVEKGYIAERHG